MQPKVTVLGLAVLTAVAVSCSAAGPGAGVSSATEGAELAAVIGAVQRALVESQSSELSGFPPLKTVTLKLRTVAARAAGGEIRLVVFSAGASVKTEATSTIEIEMKPPPPPGRKLLRPEELTDALARAIRAAEQGLASASRGDPPLLARSVQIELKFTVSQEGSAGGSIKLVPVGLEASGGISSERVHTVSLVFSQ